MTLGISAQSWSSTRSLSIWRDNAALQGFLRSKPHLAAARRVRELMFDWEGANWEATDLTELPTFAEARARLDAVRGEHSGFASY